MKIYPFLAAFALYHIAFLEFETPKQSAYNKLGLDLGDLEENLRTLNSKISGQTTSNEEVNERVNRIIDEVKKARSMYSYKAKHEINKDTSIEESLKKVKTVIEQFDGTNSDSSDASNNSIEKIEQIWEKEIRVTFDRAMHEN